MQARTYRDLAAFDDGVGLLRDYFTRLEASASATPLQKLEEPSDA